MLTLGRKVGEKVVIQTPQGEVVVTVVDVRCDKVCLGFEAPRSIPVVRGELMAEWRDERRAK